MRKSCFSGYSVFISFPANIKALEDMWIVGDRFMNSIFRTLQELKDKAVRADKPTPFIYERFNVFHFYRSSLTHNAYIRMLNSFVDALNRRPHLPKYILLVPDKDLLEAIDFFNFGITKILGTCLNWLAKQFERMLESRHENIFKKCPGALRLEETKLIWVKMICRPQVKPSDARFKVLATRAKLNNTLDDLAVWHKNIQIISITSLSYDKDFDFI